MDVRMFFLILLIFASSCSHEVWGEESSSVLEDEGRNIGESFIPYFDDVFDLSRAKIYAERCDKGDVNACFTGGLMFVIGGGDYVVKGMSMLHYACDAGNAPSCANVGYVYLHGIPGTKPLRNPKKGVFYSRKSCDAGVVVGCTNLGIAYMESIGVDQNRVVGARMIKKSCEAGEMGACAYLGEMHLVGVGVEKSVRDGYLLIEKSCLSGMDKVCARLDDICRRKDVDFC